MRCRPNDLAEIIAAGPHAAHLIGVRVVVTKSLPRPADGIPCWLYVAFDGKRLRTLDGNAIHILEDHNLRPIRGEEHDGPDEVAVRTGKPFGLDVEGVPLQ